MDLVGLSPMSTLLGAMEWAMESQSEEASESPEEPQSLIEKPSLIEAPSLIVNPPWSGVNPPWSGEVETPKFLLNSSLNLFPEAVKYGTAYQPAHTEVVSRRLLAVESGLDLSK